MRTTQIQRKSNGKFLSWEGFDIPHDQKDKAKSIPTRDIPATINAINLVFGLALSDLELHTKGKVDPNEIRTERDRAMRLVISIATKPYEDVANTANDWVKRLGILIEDLKGMAGDEKLVAIEEFLQLCPTLAGSMIHAIENRNIWLAIKKISEIGQLLTGVEVELSPTKGKQ